MYFDFHRENQNETNYDAEDLTLTELAADNANANANANPVYVKNPQNPQSPASTDSTTLIPAPMESSATSRNESSA